LHGERRAHPCEVFDEIYVQPAASDDGTALGRRWSGPRSRVRCGTSGSRCRFSDRNRRRGSTRTSAYGGRVCVTPFESLGAACAAAAERIAAGGCGLVPRTDEFGPRALGHRSILADPGHPAMRERINAMVKMREASARSLRL